VLTLFSTVLLQPDALARDKTDVVILKNGDRITGEVKRLQNAVLVIDVPYIDGSIQINWLDVARLESKELFLVHLQDGSIFTATVVNADSPEGQPVMIEVRPENQPSLVVEKTQVVGMNQASDSIWQRFAGSLTLGATYSKGNNATQYNVGSELDYQETRWGSRATYSSSLSSSRGANTATHNQFDLIVYRSFPWKNWFYAGIASVLQSSVQGIELQNNVGFGAGRYLKNTNRLRLTVLIGSGWQKANYAPLPETPESQNTSVTLLASNLEAFSFKKSRLDLDASVASSVRAQPGRSFSRVNLSYYLKLFGKIDWNLSFYGNWDTRPPTNLPASDYGSSTGVSWTFGYK
jgi:hypothetical protein